MRPRSSNRLGVRITIPCLITRKSVGVEWLEGGGVGPHAVRFAHLRLGGMRRQTLRSVPYRLHVLWRGVQFSVGRRSERRYYTYNFTNFNSNSKTFLSNVNDNPGINVLMVREKSVPIDWRDINS